MIKMRMASPALADRGARLAGVGFTERLVPRQVGAVDYEFPTAQASQADVSLCAEPAAPSVPLPDGAAFSHFTGSCPVAHPARQDTAPAVAAPSAGAVTHSSNAILLPDHVMVLVRAVAAYERCGNERAVAIALTEYATTIGAGALARAVADLDDDLADVPAHARQAANRFRSGGP
ncbi:hypothetical protein [Mesorhizobium sp. B2-1-3A]|uniref:hypothetical protein n=1 Tax=Mesorhizobium sp. B2-1-3A TaxID=2589971 RepID=UPI00112B3059|nr:hypothetical protein [Mesorhizobium sp. B2-1-3A]TPM92700.1 hypothetical protein FJ977_27845 [Mesorhizobium sp. B2-1-3A]